jgi:hypothetical protein
VSSGPPGTPPESFEPPPGAPPPQYLETDEKVESCVNVFVNLMLILLAVAAIVFGGCYAISLGH